MLEKETVITQLTSEHQELETVVKILVKEGLSGQIVFDNWTVKDILAHISAWNWEGIKAIDEILGDRKPWFVGESDKKLDRFNHEEVQKRKLWSGKKVFKEWQESFQALIDKIKSLSDRDWMHRTLFGWTDGTQLTVFSLYGYEYEGAGHEGGHANQIEKWLKKTKPRKHASYEDVTV